MKRENGSIQSWKEGRLVGLLIETIVHLFWKLLHAAGAPIGNILSFLLWCGLSLGDFANFLLRLYRRLLKWMSNSCDVPWSSTYPTKRYHLAIGFFLLFGILSTIIKSIGQRFSSYLRQKKTLQKKIYHSQSLKEWTEHSALLRELDRLHGRRKSFAEEAKLFTPHLFNRKTQHLRELFDRNEVDVEEMIRRLREDLVRRLGNMQDT